jgi:phosphate transport system protein
MERHLDEELKQVKEKLLRMATLVEESIAQSIQGLKEEREDLPREVLRREDEVNSLDVEVDSLGLKLLALNQPMAVDLRFITSVLRIGRDLERMSDLAVNIAERTLDHIRLPRLKPLIDIPRMADAAQKMVRDSLKAFIEKDTNLARQICRRDEEVDQLNDQVFRELLTYMMEDPSSISRAVDLILISRNLERIADHATNIARDVIYMVRGEVVRHREDAVVCARADR